MAQNFQSDLLTNKCSKILVAGGYELQTSKALCRGFIENF